MITIASSSIRITNRPTLAPTQVVPTPVGNSASFTLATTIEAVGSVTLAGSRGDSAAGWSVGFIQAQWIETNWGDYRGAVAHDGSSFLQRARPPARPHQACADNGNPGDAFYGSSASGPWTPNGGTIPLPYVSALSAHPSFPVTVDVIHSDQPSDGYAVSRVNALTGKINWLDAAQLEFAFCTVLAVRSPGNKLHMLRGFYWNVNWQNSFSQVHGLTVPKIVPGGSACHVGQIFTGAPSDPRFMNVLTRAQPTNCNNIFRQASAHPNIREERQWSQFDVRR